jgi:hypothetical protein
MTESTPCPQCGAQLQVPRAEGSLLVCCPRCEHRWSWCDASGETAPLPSSPANRHDTSYSLVPILKADKDKWKVADGRTPETSVSTTSGRTSATPNHTLPPTLPQTMLGLCFVVGQIVLGLAAFAGFVLILFWRYQLPMYLAVVIILVFGTFGAIGMALKPTANPKHAGPPRKSGAFAAADRGKTIIFCPQCRRIDWAAQAQTRQGPEADLPKEVSDLLDWVVAAQEKQTIQCLGCGLTYDWTPSAHASSPPIVVCLDCGAENSLPDAERVVREMQHWGNVQMDCAHCYATMHVKVVPAKEP